MTSSGRVVRTVVSGQTDVAAVVGWLGVSGSGLDSVLDYC